MASEFNDPAEAEAYAKGFALAITHVARHYALECMRDGTYKSSNVDVNKAIDCYFNKDNGAYVFLTINTKPGTTIVQLTDCVNKYVGRRWLKDAVWCYEYHTAQGQHLHCHLAFWKGAKYPSEIKRETYSTFQDVVGNTLALNIHFLKTKELFDEKVKYIQGQKKDVKMEQVLLDREWRKENNLLDFYVIKPVSVNQLDVNV